MTRFDGNTFESPLDAERLETLLDRVRNLMEDGRWRTYAEIRAVTGGSEGGIGARLRDLRKPRFGNRIVEHRRRGEPEEGLWEYRLEPAIPAVVMPPFEFDGRTGQGDFSKVIGGMP
jgi:hypothetical protein